MRFLRLIGGAVATLWITLSLVFFMVRMAPGGPWEGDKALTAYQKQELQRVYGLDQPLWVQYGRFWENLMKGQWGVSMALEGQPVGEIIAGAFPVSAGLGLGALAVAVGLGVPLGYAWVAARGHGGWVYALALLPSFVAAPIVQQAVLAAGGQAWGYEGPRSLVWPAVILGLYYLPFVARLTQVGFKTQSRALYLRMAVAKGLSYPWALWKHGYRAALSPVIAYLAPTAAGLITGAFVVETVWGLPGLGRFFVNAVFNRDDTLLLGLVAFYTVILMSLNLLVELTLVRWNPASGKGGGK